MLPQEANDYTPDEHPAHLELVEIDIMKNIAHLFLLLKLLLNLVHVAFDTGIFNPHFFNVHILHNKTN